MSEASAARFYFSFRSPFAAIAFYRLRRSPLFKDVKFELIPLWPENIFGGHMENPADSLFKVAYIFSDAAPHGRQRKLACPLYNLKQALNNLSYLQAWITAKRKSG